MNVDEDIYQAISTKVISNMEEKVLLKYLQNQTEMTEIIKKIIKERNDYKELCNSLQRQVAALEKSIDQM